MPRHTGTNLIRILLGITLIPLSCSASSILLNQSFTGTSAPGWVFLNQAGLTAAEGIDPAGSGWLRLTGSAQNQTGFAYDNTPIPFGYGLDISFSYSVWGGTGADGFGFVLFDGSQTPTSAGAFGGSLGYAQNGSTPGLAGGILGIGFDEYGNFANPTEGRQGGIGFTPDAVSIRGPGNGSANATTANGSANYGFLFSSGSLPQFIGEQNFGKRPTGAAAQRQAEIIVDTSQIASGRLPVSVYLTAGNGAKTLVAQYDAYQEVLAYYGNNPSAIPTDIKFGFTASTGSLTDNHEIQGLQINSIQSAPGYATATPEPAPFFSLLIGVALIGFTVSRRTKGGKA